MMRCVLVSDASLKTDAYCTYCRCKIGESYAREIGTGLLYCDYDCYQRAMEMTTLRLTNRALPANTWTFNP